MPGETFRLGQFTESTLALARLQKQSAFTVYVLISISLLFSARNNLRVKASMEYNGVPQTLPLDNTTQTHGRQLD